MIDIGPPPLIIPKPAIIRPASAADLAMLPGITPSITSAAKRATFIASATSDLATITIPSSAAANDLAVLIQKGGSAAGAPSDVTPSGWSSINDGATTLNTTVGGSTRTSWKAKKLSSGDPGTSVTGMDAVGGSSNRDDKILLVFRPNFSWTSIDFILCNQQPTTGDPSAQTLDPSGEVPPVILLGSASVGLSSSSTVSGTLATEGAHIAMSDGLSLDAYYLIQNSALASKTLDMTDSGNLNILQSAIIGFTI